MSVMSQPMLFDLAPITELKVRRDPEPIVGIRLRDYQEEAVTAALEAFKTHRSTLIVCPTGGGKTVIFSEIARRIEGGRVIVIAPMRKLVHQAADKLREITGEEPGIEMASSYSCRHKPPKFVVTSPQTQYSGKNGGRMKGFPPDEVALVIIDEAHLFVSESYQKVLQHYGQNPKCRFLFVTATPKRSDGIALGKICESVAYTYQIERAIDEGWLVDVVAETLYLESMDLSKVRTVKKDFDQQELGRIISEEKVLLPMVDGAIQRMGNLKTLVFVPPTKEGSPFNTGDKVTEIFNRYRPHCARYITAKTPEDQRRRIYADFQHGDFQFLVNVGILTLGFDEPTVQGIVIMRPTKSTTLLTQIIGRALRPLSGLVDAFATAIERRGAIATSSKPWARIVDFTGVLGRHKLVTPADVLGGDYSKEVRAAAMRRVKESAARGKPTTVTAELKKAQIAAMERKKREEARRAGISANTQWKVKQAKLFDNTHRSAPVTAPRTNQAPATSKQLWYLSSLGIALHKTPAIGKAGKMIDLLKNSGRTAESVANQLNIPRNEWSGPHPLEIRLANRIKDARNGDALTAAGNELKAAAYNMPHDAYLRLVKLGTDRRTELKR